VSLYALHMSIFSTKVCVVLTLSLMRKRPFICSRRMKTFLLTLMRMELSSYSVAKTLITTLLPTYIIRFVFMLYSK